MSCMPAFPDPQQQRIFAYLAVCPGVPVAAADCVWQQKEAPLLMQVASVRGGDLSAKMLARNQGARSDGWKVLCGFFVQEMSWRNHVRSAWSETASGTDWERAVWRGLQLACRYGRTNNIYVSDSARATPPSALLATLQNMSRGKTQSGAHSRFWEMVRSSRSFAAQDFTCILTDSSPASDARGATCFCERDETNAEEIGVVL